MNLQFTAIHLSDVTTPDQHEGSGDALHCLPHRINTELFCHPVTDVEPSPLTCLTACVIA